MGLWNSEIGGAKLDVEKFEGAFVGGHDFGLAGALCSLILPDGAP